jgi:TatA/E family protein of Tat protein translocase
MFLGEIFGPDLLIVIIVLAVVLFGGAAIPKLAKNLGSAKSEFEKGMKDVKSHTTLPDTKIIVIPATDAKSEHTES